MHLLQLTPGSGKVGTGLGKKKKESHINWTPTLSLPCALYKFYFMPVLTIKPFTDEETGIGASRFF